MPHSKLSIRTVKPDEAPQLSQLAHLAKAYWGYSPKCMKAFRDELTYRPKEMKNERYLFRVGTCDKTIRSFYALDFNCLSEQSVELSALFVEPVAVGRGLGRTLFEHAIQATKTLGANNILIHSDPYTKGFYRKMGAKMIRKVPSGSIQGRHNPFMQYVI